MAYRFLRGNTAQNDAYTGPEGSITIDEEAENVRVHDGVTPGGSFRVAIAEFSLTYSPTTIVLESTQGTSLTLNTATAIAAGLLSASDKNKLDTVAAGAEPNQIVDLSFSRSFESITIVNSDGANTTLPRATPTLAGVMHSEDKSKLDGIEAGATADQTATEIKTLYESNTNTNAFTDAQETKLSGIETGAQVNTVTSVAGRTGAVTLLKSDVSLENVLNYGVASQAVAEAGNSNVAYMTPLRTAQNVSEKTGIDDLGTFTRKRSDEVYWFFAYRNSTVIVNAGSTLVFNAQETGGRGYNTSTGVFTAPVAGVYRFHVQILRQGGFNANGLNVTVSKNNLTSGTGAVKAFTEKTGTTSNDGIIQCNTMATFVLAQGDTVRVRLTDQVQVNGSTTDIYTHFQGYLI